jgi:putative transposase
MPRRKDIVPGMIYHVINRGSRRGWLCETEHDFSTLERVLLESLQTVPIPLLDYCLMSNHFHLIVRPTSASELPEFMRTFSGTHGLRWRVATNTVGDGAVYQGRYKAIPVQTDEYFVQVARYVERNPLRARMVQRAEEWRWGSLWHREIARDTFPLADWPVERPPEWLTLVNTPQHAAEVQQIRKAVNRSYPLGNSSWRKDLAKTLGIEAVPRKRGRPRQR